MMNIQCLSMGILISASCQVSAQQVHQSTDWSTASLGPTINTEYAERYSMISPDGLILYFASDRPDGLGEFDDEGRKPWDIYVAWRESIEEPFGAAVTLGPTINTPYRDHSTAFSEDGHWMYFASDRPSGCGGYDLFVSYREDVKDHFGWELPEHLGCTVNTPGDEVCPYFTVDERSGKPLLYLVRNETAGVRSANIYVSEVDEATRELGRPTPMTELNSSAHDAHFEPTHGFIMSTREGGYGGLDLWRTNLLPGADEWSQPTNLGPSINTEYVEGLPSSTTNQQLFFPSNRPGGYGSFDIYVATPAGH